MSYNFQPPVPVPPGQSVYFLRPGGSRVVGVNNPGAPCAFVSGTTKTIAVATVKNSSGFVQLSTTKSLVSYFATVAWDNFALPTLPALQKVQSIYACLYATGYRGSIINNGMYKYLNGVAIGSVVQSGIPNVPNNSFANQLNSEKLSSSARDIPNIEIRYSLNDTANICFDPSYANIQDVALAVYVSQIPSIAPVNYNGVRLIHVPHKEIAE